MVRSHVSSSRAPARGGSRPTRAAARVRRHRIALVVSILAAAAIVGAWFPVSTLLHQHEQLSAASAQLNRIDRENAALRHQEKELRTPSTLGRIAQGQYDLVPPGDQAYQVLPPSGSSGSEGNLAPTGTLGTGRSLLGSSTSRGRDGGTTSSDASSGSSGSAASASFFGRVLQTLEFWR